MPYLIGEHLALYAKDGQFSYAQLQEAIVRVPQIVAHGEEKFKQLHESAPELVAYFRDKFLPDCRRHLKKLKQENIFSMGYETLNPEKIFNLQFCTPDEAPSFGSENLDYEDNEALQLFEISGEDPSIVDMTSNGNEMTDEFDFALHVVDDGFFTSSASRQLPWFQFSQILLPFQQTWNFTFNIPYLSATDSTNNVKFQSVNSNATWHNNLVLTQWLILKRAKNLDQFSKKLRCNHGLNLC